MGDTRRGSLCALVWRNLLLPSELCVPCRAGAVETHVPIGVWHCPGSGGGLPLAAFLERAARWREGHRTGGGRVHLAPS